MSQSAASTTRLHEQEQQPLSSSDDSWAEALELEDLFDDGGGFEWEDLVNTSNQEEDNILILPNTNETLHPSSTATPLTQPTQQQQGNICSSSDSSGTMDDHARLPVFTSVDKMKEITTLTTPEMQDIMSDLHGMTRNFQTLSFQPKDKPPCATLLALLEDELSQLDPEQTQAYRQAVIQCPGLVSDERKRAFLEREDGNPSLAAVRLALYWELRHEIFGPERCFLPMTLNGAMKGEVEHMVRWPIHQLLPVKDAAGRALWFFDPSRRNIRYTLQQELMAVWYLFGEVALEDPEVSRNGIVFLCNWNFVEMKHYRPQGKGMTPPAGRIASIVEQAFPIRVRALHVCHPNRALYYLLPILLHMFGRNYRQRLQLHRGTEPELLAQLKNFALFQNCIPTELGGEVVLDMVKCLASRMAQEGSRPDPRRVQDDYDKPIVIYPRSAKRVRSASTTTSNSSPCKKSGRKSDPRMLVAVELRLAIPDLPLTDVLLQAGFTFQYKDAKTGKPVDADNVSMRQRKNQLCRRVRQELVKREEGGGVSAAAAAAAVNVSSPPQGTEGDTPTHNPATHHVPSVAVSAGDLPLEAALERINTQSTAAATTSEDDDDIGSISGESQDSFFDAILELPGVEEM